MHDTRPPAEVCAVIHGSADASWVAAARRAAAEAPLAPAQILDAPDLAAAVQAAGASGRTWMWLLEAGTVPAPEALAELLVVAEDDLRPVLVASKVLDPAGELWVDATLRHEVFEKEHSVQAAARRLVQLRTAAPGSVLVRTSMWVRCGGPRQDLPAALSMFEWSARLLRRWEDTGYLVPASVAVRHIDSGRDPDWWGRLRILAGSGWTPTEKLWEGFLLTQSVSGSVRARLRGGPGSARPDAGHRAGRGG